MADRAKTLRDLLDCVHGKLPQQPDWTGILELANRTLVTPELADGLRGGHDVPPEVRQLVKTIESQAIERNRMMAQQLDDALAVLPADCAPPILLKGTADLALEGNGPLRRITSDLDMLVRADDLPGVRSALERHGYFTIEDDGQHWNGCTLAHSDRAATIDLHTRLKITEPYIDYDWLAGEPVAVDIVGRQAFVPAPEHRAAHLILHDQVQEGDYARGAIDLRHLLDLARLNRHELVDWAKVIGVGRSPYTKRAIRAQLCTLVRLTGADIPGDHWDDAWSRLQYKRRMAQLRAPWIARPLTLTHLAVERESRSDRASAADDDAPAKRPVARIQQRVRSMLAKEALETKV